MNAPADTKSAPPEARGAPARLTGTTATATLVESPPTMVKTEPLTMSDACRLAVDLIRQLAAAHGESDALRAQLAAAEDERDTYREIASVALTQLHEKNHQLERDRASRYRLVEEFRALREKGRN